MFKKLSIIAASIVIAAVVWFWLWVKSLPGIENLKKSDPGISIKVKDDNGRIKDLIVGVKNPSWFNLSRISPHLINAVVASEDDAFFQHNGFDLDEIKNSVKDDIKKKRFSRGASTITMQLAKNLYLTKEKTLIRKVKEAYLTYRIENELTKNRILELYLNIVEWGPGIYGIGAASANYFGKSPSELDLNEASMLAVILPNPNYFNPYVRRARVERRLKYLLTRMLMEHDVSQEEYEMAMAAPVALRNER